MVGSPYAFTQPEELWVLCFVFVFFPHSEAAVEIENFLFGKEIWKALRHCILSQISSKTVTNHSMRSSWLNFFIAHFIRKTGERVFKVRQLCRL